MSVDQSDQVLGDDDYDGKLDEVTPKKPEPRPPLHLSASIPDVLEIAELYITGKDDAEKKKKADKLILEVAKKAKFTITGGKVFGESQPGMFRKHFAKYAVETLMKIGRNEPNHPHHAQVVAFALKYKAWKTKTALATAPK